MKRYRPKRRVVERKLVLLDRFRNLHIRWGKKARNYLGLVHRACSMMVYLRMILG
jgi:hypothetical protein